MTGPEAEELIVEWPEAGICLLRMSRPKAYNALNRAMLRQMLAAIEALPGTQARVLILAASAPGFCSGADLKERKGLDDDEKYQHNRLINQVANALAAAPVCTIAAINGIAMGGGLELSLACDLRFATADSRLGLTEARLGAIPGAGGTQRLPRLIGTARAFEMMFAGDPVDAATAAAWGLVNGVCGDDALMDRCLAFARIVAGRSRSATAALKAVVRGGVEVTLAEGLEIERQAIVSILKSDDYKEGLAAFAEKRPPSFK